MSPDNERFPLSIGIDIGGTFTDFVVYDHVAGRVTTFKLLSTPADPAQAVLEGLRRLSPSAGHTVVHGSTVATNALLERKGACTAFVTTQGFRDVLQIGRQTRRNLYDWFSGGVPCAPVPPAPGCPGAVSGTARIIAGRVLRPADKKILVVPHSRPLRTTGRGRRAFLAVFLCESRS